MQPQDDQALWNLLQKGVEPRVPGNFADNVLRRIRLKNVDSNVVSLRSWWRNSWKAISGLSAGAAFLALLTTSFLWQDTRSSAYAGISDRIPGDLSILLASNRIKNLDELRDLNTTIDENDIWLDTVSY